MSKYEKLTLKEIFELCQSRIKNVYANVASDFYPEMKDQEHLKIKIYQSIDRTNMYIATKIVSETFYSFNLESYLENRDRKTLIKIINGVDGLTYETVRNTWHDSLKELFYRQKEDVKIQEKLNSICVIARTSPDAPVQGFLRLINGEVTISKYISDATEFVATSDNQKALDDVKNIIKKETGDESSYKIFFNGKMKGRNIFQSIK